MNITESGHFNYDQAAAEAYLVRETGNVNPETLEDIFTEILKHAAWSAKENQDLLLLADDDSFFIDNCLDAGLHKRITLVGL
jgi:hypothetical protein